jgi:hypothetical protein
VYGCGQARANDGTALRRCTWLFDFSHGLASTERRLCLVCLPPSCSPFSSLGTAMASFGSVVKTKCPATGFATEWEEVELIAIRILAMRPDQGRVFLVHFDEARFLRGV